MADGGDGDVEPGDSASAVGNPKGEELTKAVGAMFDSMVPLKSKKSNRSSSDSEDGGQKKKRKKTAKPSGTPNPEARVLLGDDWTDQSSHLLDFESFLFVSGPKQT